MAEDDDASRDDGLPWGYIDAAVGDWIVLPKIPLLRAGLGPPPFNVTLPSGEVRHVIHQPMPFCEDCPPADYPTDKTRCVVCPHRKL